jgi:hypothetical protein
MNLREPRSHLSVAIAIALFAAAGNAQITFERPVSTPVFTPLTSILSAAIASDGVQFLAAWIDSNGLFVSRIGPDGSVLDPTGIFIAPGSGTSPVGAAWDGEAYVIVWPRFSGTMAARITPDGRIVDQPRVIAQGNSIYGQSSIAANENVTVVANKGSYYVLDHELRVIVGGSLLGASVFRTGSNEFTLLAPDRVQRLDSSGHSKSIAVINGLDGDSVSCHGDDCIRVSSNALTNHLTVAQYDPISLTSGTPLDLAMTQRPFALVATAAGYLIATSDGAIQRLDLSGHPNGSSTPPCCVPSGTIAAASNGRQAVVLRKTYFALTFAMITPSSEGSPLNLALSENAQRSPAIAKSGTNYLAAWTENDGVYAGRLSFDGTILDGRGRHLAGAAPLALAPKPPPSASVTFDGASYLAAISTSFDPGYGTPRNGSITTVRIDPATGAILALNMGLPCGTDMRIASNGSTTIAAWIDCAGAVDAAFLDANGALASIPVTVAVPPTGGWAVAAHPSLAWNGTEWLITWEDQFEYSINDPFQYPDHVISLAVRGARVSSELIAIDTKPMTITRTNGSINSSRVASDGHDFLAVWSDDNTIHARPVSASGLLANDQQVASGQVQDLTWDGTAYSVAFTSALTNYDKPTNLGLLRLRPSAQPIASLAISNTADDERSAALVSLGGGSVLAAYTRVANGIERAFIAAPRPARGRAARTVTP